MINDMRSNLVENSTDLLVGKINKKTSEEILAYVIEEKNKGNEMIKNKEFQPAVEHILMICEIIEKIDSSKMTSEIKSQLVNLRSNAALCYSQLKQFELSVKQDLIIIKNLDKNFSKSFARLILSYLERNNFGLANYYACLMKKTFPPNVYNLYSNIFERVEKEKAKNQKGFNDYL